MPELPEVQTIVSDLQKILPGLKILDVLTDAKNLFRGDVFEKFKKETSGEKILEIKRNGKNILIHLSANKTILIHQKMTGHLLYGKWKKGGEKWTSEETGPMKDDPMNRFVHVIFVLSNGKQLALSDMRKFAKILLSPTDTLSKLKDLNIGIDPLDKNFTLKKLKEIIKIRHGGKIKTVLMDQTLVAGIGNIYSDEILWLSGINPLKKAGELNTRETENLHEAIKEILIKAVKARGTSSSDYRDPSGKKGNYQNMVYVYRLTGKPCQKKDGGVITRIKVGGRSAHYCPVHQKP